MNILIPRRLSSQGAAFSIAQVPRSLGARLQIQPQPQLLRQSQQHRYACQIHHPTKLHQLRAKLRAFGNGHVELDLNHSPGLALLTLSNPSKHNSLTGKMMAELTDCIDFLEDATSSTRSNNEQPPQFHPDSGLILKCAGKTLHNRQLAQEHNEILQDLVGVIVTGAEHKSYCAGLDLSAAKTTLLTPQAGSEMSALMVSTLNRFMRLPLLSIAAVEKAAIGGGAEMTTFCDHRCLTDQSKIQFVQTQMGVVTGWGGAGRLLTIVSNNRSLALRLLASAEPLRGGQDAIQCGFAQCTAPVGKAVERATEYMQPYVWERVPSPPEQANDKKQAGARRCVAAVRAMKRIVSSGLDDDRLERVSELEKDLFKQLWGGADNLARVEAATSKK